MRTELAAWDLRRASIHEAAHFVVARHYGIGAYATIYRNDDAVDFLTEKEWIGQCTLFRQPGDSHGRVIGLAGTVAEWFDEEPGETARIMFDCLPELSESDARMAEGFTLEDIEECLTILRDQWEDVLMLAHELAESGPVLS